MAVRRTIAWVLGLLLMVGAGSAYAEKVVLFEKEETPEAQGEVLLLDDLATEPPVEIGIQRGEKLVIGSLTAPNGAFSTEMWGNNTVDIDIRAMLHAYDTVTLTQNHGLVINTNVLKSVQVGYPESGQAVYLLDFSDQLRYNDGTPIAAKDYAFSLLLGGAPEIEAIGGTRQGRSHINGYTEYALGLSDSITGVRMVSDHELVLYVSGDYLPYFYGYAMVSMKPLPISEIAPGCDVRDDGNGIYIAMADDAATIDAAGLPYTPGVFSAEMLAETMLNAEHGYLSHPSKTTGPYSLLDYDADAGVVNFVINEHFIGNYEGQKPHIEFVEYRTLHPDTMVSDLIEGRVDLLNKMTDSSLVAEIMTAQKPDRGISQGSYLRTGFAFLAFACEDETVSSLAVRRALAMGIDKDAFIEQYLPGSALKVHGYYGLGQWMATYTGSDPDDPIDVAGALESLAMPVDLDAANAMLDADGWVYDATGAPYPGEGPRYRKTDDGYAPLALRLALTEENDIAAGMGEMLGEVTAQLGIGLDITEMAFPQLLAHYYRQEERTYNLFFMASNFNYIFDPYYDFHTADEFQGMLNTSGLRDEELMARAFELRQTPPAEMDEYIEDWLHFQERFVEVLPLVPLYSNVYFDFYTETLQNYNITLHSSWAQALPYAYFGEPEAEEFPEVDMGSDEFIIIDD